MPETVESLADMHNLPFEGPESLSEFPISEGGMDKMVIECAQNFLNMDPFLMIFAPLESWDWKLSNGAKIVKNGPMLRKLWRNSIYNLSIQPSEFPSEGDSGPSNGWKIVQSWKKNMKTHEHEKQ